MSATYPFSAIVAQDDMKLAMLLAAVDPSIGGILVFGDRGSGKSTAVRGLSALLPAMRIVAGCHFNCDPDIPGRYCPECRDRAAKGSLKAAKVPVPVVDLPLGATEDRLVGALDLERALGHGVKAFEPGLLARANRGFLYVDEVNLLEDHLVDLLLDVVASGENIVERDGLSVRHGARIVLVGTGNPEEGELRPQLLDRFGLAVEVKTPRELPVRMEVLRRRDAFERDPDAFGSRWAREDAKLRRRIEAARALLPAVTTSDATLEAATRLCVALGTDGLRGELTLMRAARAAASLDGKSEVEISHIRRMAPSALRHRLRRNPLDESGSTARVERAMAEVLGP